MSSAGIPAEAVGLVVGVLAYSVICLSTSLLLYIALITLREYTNYVTLLAGFISISTAASVSQQIEYSINWRSIKEREFEESTSNPSDTLQPAHVYGNQAIFFWIQYYCYNVDALLLFFWSINLGRKMWNPYARQSRSRATWPSIVAKITSVTLPGILIAIVQMDYVLEQRILQIILGSLCMVLSFTFGSVVVVASLIKYLINRRTIPNGSNSSNDRKGSVSAKSSHAMEDRWIIFRFTAAFVILSAFSAWLIIFQLLQSESKDELVEIAEPNFSFEDIKEDVLTFIPGVTASLGCFILFGTTAPLRRHYASWYHSFKSNLMRLQMCCGGKRQKHRGTHIGELQRSPTALNTLHVNNGKISDVERAHFNANYVVSAPRSPGVSPSTAIRPMRNFNDHGSSMELNRFAAAPAGLTEPDPLVLPSPRLTSTRTNFSVPTSNPNSLTSPSPSSPQQRQRWGNDRYYHSQSPRLPDQARGSYFAIA